MSVSCQYSARLTTAETLDATPGATAPVVNHDAYDKAFTLFASSTPPATKWAAFVKTLSGGASTVDLTALTGTNGAAVDGTGLKVRAIRIENDGANTLSVQAGASNGIDLFGASGKVVIPPGGHVQMYFADGSPVIASGDRTLDLAGTGAQTSKWSILLG